MDVMVICKKCGKKVPSSEFILDPVYKIMVCRNCHRARIGASAAPPKAEPKKPAGWDKEDETLSKIYKPKPQFEQLDSERIKVTCSRCKYRYAYNTVKQFPQQCPQCGTKRS